MRLVGNDRGLCAGERRAGPICDRPVCGDSETDETHGIDALHLRSEPIHERGSKIVGSAKKNLLPFDRR